MHIESHIADQLKIWSDSPNDLEKWQLDLLAAAIVEICELRGTLGYYADPQNTVRECVAGGACANTDHCKLAASTLMRAQEDVHKQAHGHFEPLD